MNLVIVIGMFFDGDEGAFVESEEWGVGWKCGLR